MASVADILKKAIQEGDWLQVCDLYKALTGKEIEPLQPKKLEILTVDEIADLDINLEIGAKTYSPTIIEKPVLSELKRTPKNNRIDISSFIVPAQSGDIKKNEPTSGKTSTKPSDRRVGFADLNVRARVNDDSDDPETDDDVDKKYAKREPMTVPRKRDTGFIDDGTLDRQDMVSANPALAAMYGAAPPVPRGTRKTVSFVEVMCEECGVKDEIVSSLVTTKHYRCNRCASRGVKGNQN